MDIIITLFFIAVLWGVRPMGYNPDYIGRESTTAIKGIFAIIIIFNHANQYLLPPINKLTISNISDYRIIYDTVLGFLGQLMVVMFLVYSGYGIIESYKKKQAAYLTGFLRKRVLKTLVHFDIAVAVFIILALILGHEYSAGDYLLSWTGWTSVGNSNWFIFDIIVLYLLAYAGLLFVERFKLDLKAYLWIIFGLSVVFLVFMFKAKSGLAWWYDTILAFPMGMLWSVYKKKFEHYLSTKKGFITASIAVMTAFVLFYLLGRHYKEVFSFVASPLFGVLVIVLTTRVKIGNPMLNWLGINAFSIYILQRLAMILASEAGMNNRPLLFMAVVIPASLLIAAVFTAFTSRIDKKLFS